MAQAMGAFESLVPEVNAGFVKAMIKPGRGRWVATMFKLVSDCADAAAARGDTSAAPVDMVAAIHREAMRFAGYSGPAAMRPPPAA
eukprot:7531989-Alexandrium_andersonii.AAC.1